mgnify:CR=1 FL=1
MKRSIFSLITLTTVLSFNAPLIANESNLSPQDSITANVSYTKVDINDATLQQLMQVKGLGKTKAQAIIDFRETNGKISDMEELKTIKGIGKKTLARILEKFELGQ